MMVHRWLDRPKGVPQPKQIGCSHCSACNNQSDLCWACGRHVCSMHSVHCKCLHNRCIVIFKIFSEWKFISEYLLWIPNMQRNTADIIIIFNFGQMTGEKIWNIWDKSIFIKIVVWKFYLLSSVGLSSFSALPTHLCKENMEEQTFAWYSATKLVNM